MSLRGAYAPSADFSGKIFGSPGPLGYQILARSLRLLRPLQGGAPFGPQSALGAYAGLTQSLRMLTPLQWVRFSAPRAHGPISIDSSIHSFIHPFIPSFIHLFIRSFIHSFIHSSIHSSIHPFNHASVHSLVHLFIQSFVD